MSTVTPAQPQVSPVETVIQMMSGFWISRGLWVAAKLGLADLLKDGDKSVEELAAATETHAGSLFRVLRNYRPSIY